MKTTHKVDIWRHNKDTGYSTIVDQIELDEYDIEKYALEKYFKENTIDDEWYNYSANFYETTTK